MNTSTQATNVTFTHQGRENGFAHEWRCHINDPFTHAFGLGYGETEREAYNDARVDFQNNAASLIRSALREAQEGFDRLQKQTSVLA